MKVFSFEILIFYLVLQRLSTMTANFMWFEYLQIDLYCKSVVLE